MQLRSLHDRIDAGYGAGGRWLVRRRWLVLGLAIVGTAPLAFRLPNLRSDNSPESFLRADDPARVGYDRFREQFGQDDRIVFAVRPPEVFGLAFLERLREFHRTIEREVPYGLAKQ